MKNVACGAFVSALVLTSRGAFLWSLCLAGGVRASLACLRLTRYFSPSSRDWVVSEVGLRKLIQREEHLGETNAKGTGCLERSSDASAREKYNFWSHNEIDELVRPLPPLRMHFVSPYISPPPLSASLSESSAYSTLASSNSSASCAASATGDSNATANNAPPIGCLSGATGAAFQRDRAFSNPQPPSPIWRRRLKLVGHRSYLQRRRTPPPLYCSKHETAATTAFV